MEEFSSAVSSRFYKAMTADLTEVPWKLLPLCHVTCQRNFRMRYSKEQRRFNRRHTVHSACVPH